MKIELFAHGELQINRRMMRWSHRAGNLTEVFASVAEYWMEVERELFYSEGASGNHPWAKLSESTIDSKESRGLEPGILRATDKLYESLTSGLVDDETRHRVITPQTLIFGSKLPYARMHQKPGSRARYPQRRPIDLNESNKVITMKMVQYWITRGIVKAGAAVR